MYSSHGKEKGAPDPLELDLETDVSHPEGAENQTWAKLLLSVALLSAVPTS